MHDDKDTTINKNKTETCKDNRTDPKKTEAENRATSPRSVVEHASDNEEIRSPPIIYRTINNSDNNKDSGAMQQVEQDRMDKYDTTEEKETMTSSTTTTTKTTPPSSSFFHMIQASQANKLSPNTPTWMITINTWSPEHKHRQSTMPFWYW